MWLFFLLFKVYIFNLSVVNKSNFSRRNADIGIPFKKMSLQGTLQVLSYTFPVIWDPDKKK